MDNKINLNIYTSYIFFINVLVGLIVGHYTYALIFLILVITSIIHHSMLTDITENIDKSVVYLVVIYGGYIFYNNVRFTTCYEIIMTLVIVISFVLTGVFYSYGKCNNCLCWDPDLEVGRGYHSIVHCVSSFGHILIMLL